MVVLQQDLRWAGGILRMKFDERVDAALVILRGQAQWEKLRENDRVTVNYRVGKYTGTFWDSQN